MKRKKRSRYLPMASPLEASSQRARCRVKSLSLIMKRGRKVKKIVKKKRMRLVKRKLMNRCSSSMKRGLQIKIRKHL